MFFAGSLRRSRLFIDRTLPNQQFYACRSVDRSQGSITLSPSSPLHRAPRSGSGQGRSWPNEAKSSRSLPYSSALLVVVGSSCFLGYSSFVSFAENDTDEIVWDSGDDYVVPSKRSRFIFGDTYRRRVFFNYEKRLRLQSPPEKVFEYFASLRTPEKEVLMTPGDLMRAVVPVFPPSESDRVREGFLRGEKAPGELQCDPSQFFMLFDTNGDGLISFPEYIFFVTLLSIPESSFSVAFKMFDLDNNGYTIVLHVRSSPLEPMSKHQVRAYSEIDREEFKKVMSLMRAQNRQGASHREGRRLGLKVAESVENDGLLEYFFGKDGKTCLRHERFVQFLSDLHHEMLRLEFAHYDYKSRGTISARDFALSLVASADISHINKLLDRVDELGNVPSLRDIRITFQEFKNFAELRRQLESLSLAIFSYGKINGALTKKDFQRASSQVCGISITDDLVDIIFHVFDANRDGSLSSDEFIRVLQRREKDSSLSRGAGLAGLVSCCLYCAKCTCSASKNFI